MGHQLPHFRVWFSWNSHSPLLPTTEFSLQLFTLALYEGRKVTPVYKGTLQTRCAQRMPEYAAQAQTELVSPLIPG